MASLSEGLTAPRQPLPREYSSVELFSIQAAARILNVPTSELFRLAETIANTTNASCHIEPYRFNVLSNPPVIHHPIPTHAGTSSTLAPGPSQSTVHPTAEKGVVNGSAGQSSSILTSDAPSTDITQWPDLDAQVVAPTYDPTAMVIQRLLQTQTQSTDMHDYAPAPTHQDLVMATASPSSALAFPTATSDEPLGNGFASANDVALFSGDQFNDCYTGPMDSLPDLATEDPHFSEESLNWHQNFTQDNDHSSSPPDEQDSMVIEPELQNARNFSAVPLGIITGPVDLSEVRRAYSRKSLSKPSNSRSRPSTGIRKATGGTVGALHASRIKKPTQKVGACISCSINRKGCVPGPESGSCMACSTRKYSMCRLPCIYLQIPDTILFRTMTDPISSKPYTALGIDNSIFHPVQDSSMAETKTIELTQGYGTTVKLSVHRVDTSAGETADMSDAEKSMYSHPYGIADLDAATEDIRAFLWRSVGPYVKAKVDPSDSLTRSIFKAAGSYTKPNTLNAEFVTDVLILWTAARTIEGGWQFCGSESLGLSPDRDGVIPLLSAPLIDYQFSGLMVQQFLLPLRKKVLKKLYDLTHASTAITANNWFVLALVNFVLLHTYGLLMNQQRRFARDHNANVRYTLMPLVRGIHAGAKTLLAHFHFICKGQKPFDIDWCSPNIPEKISKTANLTKAQMEFLSGLRGKLRQKLPTFIDLVRTDDYESDHWFTGQMFIPNWEPLDTIEYSPPA